MLRLISPNKTHIRTPDLLLAGSTQEDYMEGTCLFLSLLWEAVYKVFRKRDQICQNIVKYLGFHLSQGQCSLSPERKQAICFIPAPKTHRQIREFLGPADFCQIWMPNYPCLTKPLCETTKRVEWEPLVCRREQEKAFKEIKKALTNAPALGLLDVMKPFFLYVHEQRGAAIGVLTQLLAPDTGWWLTCQNNLMPFPEAGHLACVP
jgi:hypothetical protein